MDRSISHYRDDSKIKDVPFTEYKEASAFDHLKIAFRKAKVADWIAYAIILILSSWVIFCWMKVGDRSYHWRYADMETWKYSISNYMDFTRTGSIYFSFFGGVAYLAFWVMNKSSNKPAQ